MTCKVCGQQVSANAVLELCGEDEALWLASGEYMRAASFPGSDVRRDVALADFIERMRAERNVRRPL
jgi:hypothetical protein